MSLTTRAANARPLSERDRSSRLTRPVRWAGWAALLLLLTAALLPQPCLACSCAQRLPAQALAESSAVFHGRVIERTGELALPPPARLPRWLPEWLTDRLTDWWPVARPVESIVVRFEVLTTWKGVTTSEVLVETPAGGDAGCGITLRPGREYLVYTTTVPGRALFTSLCHRTQLMAEVQEDLLALGPGQPLPPAPARPPDPWPSLALGAGLLGLLAGGWLLWRRRRR